MTMKEDLTIIGPKNILKDCNPSFYKQGLNFIYLNFF